MAEANGEVAARDPDALVTEIERTREDLARTVDRLADWVSPANVARRALDRAREHFQRPEARMAGGAVAALAVLGVLGVAVYLIRRRAPLSSAPLGTSPLALHDWALDHTGHPPSRTTPGTDCCREFGSCRREESPGPGSC